MLRGRRGTTWAALAMAVLLVGGPPSAAADDTLAVFSANLDRASGVDINANVGSAQLSVTLFEEGEIFDWTADLTGVTDVIKVHIHIMEVDAAPGAIGPVAVVLAPANGTSSTDELPADQLLSGDVSPSGTFTATKFLNLAKDLTAAQFVEATISNRMYVAVHTQEWPAGALRGQLVLESGGAGPSPPPPPPTAETVSTVLSANLDRASGVDITANVGSAQLSVTLFEEGEIFDWTADLTGVTDVIKVHIHIMEADAAPGAIGPVAVVLAPANGTSSTDELPADQLLSGDVSPSGTFTATSFLNLAEGMTAAQFVEATRSNRMYVAVHTQEWPAGALRGQLAVEGVGAAPPPPPTTAQTVSAVLTPPSGTAGATTGTFIATLAGEAFSWELELKGIVGLTKVHIHQGDRVVGGPLVVNLDPVGTGSPMMDPPFTGNYISEGTFTAADFGTVLTGLSIEEFMRQAADGQLYVNCHTVDAPNGAVSGVLQRSGPIVVPPPPAAKSSVPIGAIVGGVAGAVALAAVGAGFFIWSRKRKQRADKEHLAEAGKSFSYKQGAPSSDSQPKGPSPLGQAYSGWQLQSQGTVTDTFLTASKLAPTQHSSPNSRQSQPSSRPKPQLSSDPLLALIASNLSSRPGTGSRLLESGGNASVTSHASRATTTSHRPDVQHLMLKWEDLLIEQRIGAGSFGQVFSGKYFSTPVAVKILVDRDTFDAGALTLPAVVMQSLEEETRVLSRIRHPNVLSLMGLCERPACIITELCQHGSLYDVLRGGASDPDRAAHLTWKLRLGMAIDAATGILYLHSRSPPIIHRDLKSPNLLVDKHYTVKVGDFGLSKVLEEHTMGIVSAASSLGGALNPIWLSPEMLRGDKATSKSDVFAFALILWELLTWRLPWGGMAPFKIMQAVLGGERLPIPPPQELPGVEGPFPGINAYCQLICECWADDPADRPAFDAIVARLEDMLPLAS